MGTSFASQRRTSFKGDVLRLVSGTAAAQAIGLLSAPILTRLFAPEAFGLAAAFTALVAIPAVIACFRYELAIVLPETDREGANVFGVCLACVALTTTVAALFFVLFGNAFLGWLNLNDLRPFVWLLPLSIFLSGFFTALNYWNTRTKHFARISLTKVTTALCMATGKIAAGFAGFTSGATLIYAGVGGNVLNSSMLGGLIASDNGRFFTRNIRWEAMRRAAIRYKKFPLFSSWGILLNYGTAQLPVLLLAFFFTPAVVGFYALGNRVLKIPTALLGNAIFQVFFQRASVARAEGNLPKIIQPAVKWLTLFAAFPSLFLFIAAPDLFAFVFGEPWREAGVYASILAPMLFFSFMFSPISNLFSTLEKQEASLVFAGIMSVARSGSLVLGGLMGDVKIALSAYTVCVSITYMGGYVYILKVAGVELIGLFRGILSRIFTALLFVVPMSLAVFFFDLTSFWIVLVGALTALAYGVLIVAREPEASALLRQLKFRR